MISHSYLLFVLLGAVFWASGVVLFRVLGESVVSQNNPLLIGLYLFAFPIGRIFIWLTQKMTGLLSTEMVPGMVWMTTTALLIDGIVISWFPWVYGESDRHVRLVAGSLLWGAGAGIAVALWLGRQRSNIGTVKSM